MAISGADLAYLFSLVKNLMTKTKTALTQLGVWGALGAPQWDLEWNPRNKRKFRGFEL